VSLNSHASPPSPVTEQVTPRLRTVYVVTHPEATTQREDARFANRVVVSVGDVARLT
jgi:hypothetical protein